MIYGSPSHRLEESLRATSRVLEIDAQFFYVPGCMIISFDDSNTKTSSMHLVRVYDLYLADLTVVIKVLI